MKAYLSYNEEAVPEGFTRYHPSAIETIEPNTVDEVQGMLVLEKLPDMVTFMEHLYYRLKPGAKAVFQSGYYGCATSFMSPLIKRSLSEHSMNWCSKSWREANKFTEIKTDIDFEVAVGLATASDLNLRAEEVQVLWRATRLNCVLQVHFTLTKVANENVNPPKVP
jgi:hypothetical protein